jgi:hypothetical protein
MPNTKERLVSLYHTVRTRWFSKDSQEGSTSGKKKTTNCDGKITYNDNAIKRRQRSRKKIEQTMVVRSDKKKIATI